MSSYAVVYPIRCYSCQRYLADKVATFVALLDIYQDKENARELALNDADVTLPCCRSGLLLPSYFPYSNIDNELVEGISTGIRLDGVPTKEKVPSISDFPSKESAGEAACKVAPNEKYIIGLSYADLKVEEIAQEETLSLKDVSKRRRELLLQGDVLGMTKTLEDEDKIYDDISASRSIAGETTIPSVSATSQTINRYNASRMSKPLITLTSKSAPSANAPPAPSSFVGKITVASLGAEPSTVTNLKQLALPPSESSSSSSSAESEDARYLADLESILVQIKGTKAQAESNSVEEYVYPQQVGMPTINIPLDYVFTTINAGCGQFVPELPQTYLAE